MKTDKQESILVPHFAGFKCLGYLVPKAGQHIWMHGESLRETVTDFTDTKFLVYEKLPPKRYIFEETGEYRFGERGDYILNGEDCLRWSSVYLSRVKYKILRRINE